MFVLFFLGGSIPTIGEVLFARFVNMPDHSLQERQLDLLNGLRQLRFDEATAKHLSTCPASLYFFLFKGVDAEIIGPAVADRADHAREILDRRRRAVGEVVHAGDAAHG